MRLVTREEAVAEVRATAQTLAGGCVMCAIAHDGWDADLVVAQTEAAVVVLDRYAHARGHLLVISRTHVERVESLDRASFLALSDVVWRATQALSSVVTCERIYVASLGGSGSSLGVTVPHVHVHLVPITQLDEGARPARVFTWTNGVHVYDGDEGLELARSLAAAWVT